MSELTGQYHTAIEKVEDWIGRKAFTDSATYVRKLEELLLDAARANRKIREIDDVKKEDGKM